MIKKGPFPQMGPPEYTFVMKDACVMLTNSLTLVNILQQCTFLNVNDVQHFLNHDHGAADVYGVAAVLAKTPALDILHLI